MRGSWQYCGAALVLALVSIAAPTDAQVPEVDQRGQEQLITRLLDHATAELNLSVEQRDRLRGVMVETIGRRRELARRQFQLGREIQAALSNPATTEESFRSLAEANLALRREGADLIQWQQQQLSDFLTARQSLRFLLMQDRLARRIEEMRRNRARGRRQP